MKNDAPALLQSALMGGYLPCRYRWKRRFLSGWQTSRQTLVIGFDTLGVFPRYEPMPAHLHLDIVNVAVNLDPETLTPIWNPELIADGLLAIAAHIREGGLLPALE